jgi:hypothetical protein
MATKEFEDFKGADPAPDYSSLEPESRRFLLHQCRRKVARGGNKEGAHASGKPALCPTGVKDVLTILANIPSMATNVGRGQYPKRRFQAEFTPIAAAIMVPLVASAMSTGRCLNPMMRSGPITHIAAIHIPMSNALRPILPTMAPPLSLCMTGNSGACARPARWPVARSPQRGSRALSALTSGALRAAAGRRRCFPRRGYTGAADRSTARDTAAG